MTTKYRFKKRQRPARLMTKIIPILATGFGFVAFAMIVPAGTSSKTEARIFTQGLSIQIDRSSPAYAALEDTLATDTQSVAQVQEAQRIELIPAKTLVSGVRDVEPVAIRIVRQNAREESLMAQERSQRIANTQALVAALGRAVPSSASNRSVALPVEIAEATASGATVISNGEVISAPAQTVVSSAVINHPAIKISRADIAKLFQPLIQAPPKPTAFPSTGAGAVSRVSSSARIAGLDAVISPASVMRAPARAAQEDVAAPENPNKDIHQVVISGPVTFAGGIAITSGNDRVVIYREQDEEHFEDAQVSLRDANYEVFVDQPIGRLVGELRSVSGEILGRGYFELARLPRITSSKYRLDKIAMTINPIPHGITGKVMTAAVASDANPKALSVPVKNAHIQIGQLPFDTLSKKDGVFKEDSLVEGSTIITHADRPGHWGSLAFATVGSPVELPMFSDATMRAVMQAATGSDHENERNSAFVWGRVTRAGQPAAGAHVDLMTSENKPVYFNAMNLPDASLTETSANGLYAFFPVEPGSHAVQAADGHGMTEPSLFPTDEQTATQVNLELNITKNAKIRVYDAFKTDWPLEAEVLSPGRKHGALIPKTGQALVTFTGGDNLLFLDTDAGTSYERVRTLATRAQRKIDIPMVQTVWISRIKGALRINEDARTGTIVGFIRGTPSYQVSLEKESLGLNTRTIYFDKNGEMTQANYGVAGGGFMILNVPQGFRTVLVQPSGTTKALAQTVLVESSVTNMINKTF